MNERRTIKQSISGWRRAVTDRESLADRDRLMEGKMGLIGAAGLARPSPVDTEARTCAGRTSVGLLPCTAQRYNHEQAMRPYHMPNDLDLQSLIVIEVT